MTDYTPDATPLTRALERVEDIAAGNHPDGELSALNEICDVIDEARQAYRKNVTAAQEREIADLRAQAAAPDRSIA